MAYITSTVTIPAPQPTLFSYLRNRYDSEIYRKVCQDVKGYVPVPLCIKEVSYSELEFRVEGRDWFFPSITMSSWKWGYQLQPISPAVTEVTMWYRWGILMTLFSLGSVRHQAGNELAETGLALLALSIQPTSGN